MNADDRIQLILGALSFRTLGRDYQFKTLMRGLVEPGHTLPTAVVRSIAETLGYEGSEYCDVLWADNWDADSRFWARPRD